MDEWQVSLQTILQDAGAWSRLTSEQKAQVPRVRTWLSAAIDTTTRCILALRLLSAPPSAASAISALEMIVTDKSPLSDAVRAQTPWDMHGVFETIAMDSGAAFIAGATQAVIRDLGSEPLYPPSGMPQMRAHIERAFRTLGQRALNGVPGQTFENVVAKGDYDSVGNACLDVEELNRTLIRYVVDVYHNTPHHGLAGETPRNAWLRLTKQHALKPPLSPNMRRHIFGLTAERRIGHRGIRFLGLHYQSPDIQRLRQKLGQKQVRIRVSRMDLSAISVWTESAWMSVPYQQAGIDLRGVSYWEWVAAAEDLARGNADSSKLSADIVNAALRKCRETVEMATKRAEIGRPILTGEEVERTDRSVFRSFGFVDDGADPGIDILGDEGETSTGDVDDPASAAIPPSPRSDVAAGVVGGTAAQQHIENEVWDIED
jgi:putative transposase